MPKRIITRSTGGCKSNQLFFRTGHRCKIHEICSTMTNPLIDGVTYVEQMNQINKEFFIPYFDNPYDVDPRTIYLDLLTFLESERERYLISRPDIVTQVEFMINAMTLVRKDASQYFIKNLQNAALAQQIETTIQGLLTQIYFLNTKIAILSGVDVENTIGGKATIQTVKMKDPRYTMAKLQPHLTMLSFLYPNEPSAHYYMRLKRLLQFSGLYTNEEDITNDLVAFLDRHLVKHDLTLTLEQWMALTQKDDELISDKEQKYVEERLDEIERLEENNEFLEKWSDAKGRGSIIPGRLKITTLDVDKILSDRYNANIKDLDRKLERFKVKDCDPNIIKVKVDSDGKAIRSFLVNGTFNMSSNNNIGFGLENIPNNMIDKMYPRMPSSNQPPTNIKDPIIVSPKSKTPYYPTRSKTCKNNSKKTINNKTRKNICH